MLGRESRNENSEPQDSNKWVKKLQQESWELELLVSGFSIVLLSKLTEWLQVLINDIPFTINMHDSFSAAIFFFMSFLLLASYALIINLIVHLVFRGFWVGIVGLGSVAPNTDLTKLKYSKFFVKKLKKRIVKLDDLVIVVDKISSLIFTFAFLIIFFLISVGLFLIGLTLISEIGVFFVSISGEKLSTALKTTTIIISLVYTFAGIIYMIDFLTLGFFKKFKWLSKIYYPIYHFFGWITLSFLYRTLYYNLISKFSKRKIGLILIPYLSIILIVPLTNFSHYIYFPEESESSHIENNYYSELRKSEDHIEKVDIPSYVIDNKFLPIFLTYIPEDNEIVKKLYPEYTPDIKEGFNSKINMDFHNRGLSIGSKKMIDKQKKSLECLTSLYQIYLNDSLIQNPKFYFKQNAEKEEKGIFTMINISELEIGENILLIKKMRFKGDEKIFKDYAFVPFWKE
jgi:hypothetical protein